MTWNDFIGFGSASVLLWGLGAVCAYKTGWRRVALLFTGLGLFVFLVYIAGMWISLERPPLRTMGETRLFYSFFMTLVGCVVYYKWRYAWILSFSTVLATVFVLLNILKPEIHDKVLMPALQSPWFVPHVIVYMFAYALLGCAFLLALYGMLKRKRVQRPTLLATADNLVYTGIALLTLGMLFGALWAKEAWGHYWNWDPKETWAAITWFAYLSYVHVRFRYPEREGNAAVLLCVSFFFLQICWYGVNYLPAAAKSIHTYMN